MQMIHKMGTCCVAARHADKRVFEGIVLTRDFEGTGARESGQICRGMGRGWCGRGIVDNNVGFEKQTEGKGGDLVAIQDEALQLKQPHEYAERQRSDAV